MYTHNLSVKTRLRKYAKFVWLKYTSISTIQEPFLCRFLYIHNYKSHSKTSMSSTITNFEFIFTNIFEKKNIEI